MTKHNKGNQQQSKPDGVLPGRRKVLEMMGMTAVALPILGLQACGSDDGAGSAASAMDKVEPAMKDMAKEAEGMAGSAMDKAEGAMDDAQGTMDEAGDAMEEAMEEAADSAETMVKDAKEGMDAAASEGATIASDATAKLDESSPQAAGLGYKHDATTVKNARYAAGQQCSNCALYQGGDSAWGGCPLFAGKQVKATGWCSAYSAAS
ncbi:high-potential iron-sulfur protein [Congregibacter litoralis]|uniref:High-potential iron-sulfur protein n=1 Tax=Congregibacter litoralis KT71 TaxID=314285 RepID=A4A9V4_9GAMM|nr:high-potential iron-sulfur protein [Congregibacter litoralis]EAQ97271.1 High potential iron-sulfur protein [Congregibacter litoralis KT71]